MNSPNGIEMFELELVDIGAGSGRFSAAICREIKNIGLKPKLRLWFVDLELTDPTRFFRNQRLRDFTDNLTFIEDDYRDWLIRPQPLPNKSGLRIGLVSKLFNNLSTFSVCYLSDEIGTSLFKNMEGYSKSEAHRPSICLAPGGFGVKSLAISSSRVPLQKGRTFFQVSLSAFYQSIYFLSRITDSSEALEGGWFLPVRSFNPECLVTKEGKSVISVLSEICDYVIVEDADLSPQGLIDHMTKYSLGFLTIYDMTKALKLKGNYLYIIWTRKAIAPQLPGERIW